ncbi:glycosyltransferase family 2 protein [Neobacillus sp. LXY-4]|uniref:glycosyltransferase family 2 protein n=1 Tax=Neobacillus sp. LXY-4 TaxID=3379826 RepID=UPI003EDFE63B
MKISIIVAAYNVEKYIEKCLKSITSQTFKELEIIVVNDGSIDSTQEIINNIALTDKRIVIINKPNGGLSSARNAGLDKATGDYIGFIDGDDYITEDLYENLLGEILNNKCQIAMCAVLKVYYDYSEHDGLVVDSTVLNRREAIKALIEEKYIKHYAVNKLYQAQLFKNVRYPEGRLYEDIFTTYKLFAGANKIAYSNKIGYYYTQRQGSILRSKFNIRKLDCLQAFREFKVYVDATFPELSGQLLWRLNLSLINSLLDMLKSESLYRNCEFNEMGSILTKEIRKNSLFYLKSANIPMIYRILAVFTFGGYPFMRTLFKTPFIKSKILKRSTELL